MLKVCSAYYFFPYIIFTVTHSETQAHSCKHIQCVTCRHAHLSHTHSHNCFLKKLTGTRIVSRESGWNNCDIPLKAPLECKVMNIFSMEPAFCAVKISCSEMNKMVFRLAFWGSTSPTLYTHFTWLFFFANFAPLPRVPYMLPCFSPHTSPLLPILPLLLPSILISVCCVWARLHGWRKGKERRGEG